MSVIARHLSLSSLLIACAKVAAAQAVPTANPRANASTLPPTLAAALARDGCRVPASPSELGSDSQSVIPHVAYRTSVRGSDATDWVVICEHDSRREVLVFAEPVAADSQPALRLDIEWDPNDEGCEGWITVADSAWVRLAIGKERSLSGHQPVAPSEIAALHAGIVDSMCEGEDAHIRYWTGRRWIALPAYWDEPGHGAR
jgi:hypothetical protein